MPKEKRTIFYAWQSDINGRVNRYFISNALKAAVEELNNDISNPYELSLDHDTLNEPGSPKITETILKKIDRAAVFVGDISIIGKVKRKKHVSNPNVMLELGYALKSLSERRMILVANTSQASIEKLPFDTKINRVLPYNLSEKDLDAKNSVQILKSKAKQLQSDLKNAINLILRLPETTNVTESDRRLGGITYLAQNICQSFGPEGKPVLLNKITTRDGVRIAENLPHNDRISQEAMFHLMRVGEEMRHHVGDGAKTSMIICEKMIDGFYQAKKQGLPTSEMLEIAEETVQSIVETIRDEAYQITDVDIYAIAKTAGNRTIANFLTQGYTGNGKNEVRILEYEISTEKTSISKNENFEIPYGYAHEDFANDPLTGDCRFENCLVLPFPGKLYDSNSLIPLLEEVAKEKSPLLIIAEDISDEIINLLLKNNAVGVLNTVAVKSSQLSGGKAILKDLAIYTGAVVSETSANVISLGSAASVKVSNSSTKLLGGGGKPEDILLRQTLLRQQIDLTPSDYEREKLQARLANISGTKTIINFRARTQTDLEQIRYLSKTAMSSVDSALRHGYVTGGGLDLFHKSDRFREDFINKLVSNNQTTSASIIINSLKEPLNLILRQNNKSAEEFSGIASTSKEIGFNVLTKAFENLKDAGIIDSADLITSAIEIAFSNAKNIIRTL